MLRCLEKLAEIVGFKSFSSLGNNSTLSVKRGERRDMIFCFQFFPLSRPGSLYFYIPYRFSIFLNFVSVNCASFF